MKKLIQYAVVLATVLGLPVVSATTLTQQRQQFMAARQAYSAGELATWQRLSAGLKNYPLYPYLRYPYLRDRRDSVPSTELQEFLDSYGDSPPGTRLRNAWLTDLGYSQRWTEYLRLYRESDDTSLQCYAVQARLNTAPGKPDAALLDAAEALWRVGHSQPKACDGVFHALLQSPRGGSALIWERIRLAMEEGELQLATHLANRLSPKEQAWVERWQTVYQRPAAQLDNPALNEDLPIVREIIAFGVRRLARTAAETAHTRWQQLKPRYNFSAAQRAAVDSAIAIAAAKQRSPRALQWFAEIKDQDTDPTLREWRIRSAVLAGDWTHLEQWAKTLPKEEQTEAWQYWRARALEMRGSKEAGAALYREVAKERSYYGFLANDRLHQAYTVKNQPTLNNSAELAKMETRPGMRRAHEFYQLGLIPDARREWMYTTGTMNKDELAQAAQLALRWGWYERAIITAAKGEHWDDLDLRFPTPYRDHVVKNARRQQIDPAWIYGVMRQESAFMADAKSSAGALGLMQLMPATADHTARLQELKPLNKPALLTPEYNIQLGSAYLRHVLDRFRGNQLLATASYNAGPGRVRQWLPYDAAPADQWVEAIPFNETRKYVQSVMSYSVVFDWRLQQPLRPLRQRMGTAVPSTQDLAQ